MGCSPEPSFVGKRHVHLGETSLSPCLWYEWRLLSIFDYQKRLTNVLHAHRLTVEHLATLICSKLNWRSSHAAPMLGLASLALKFELSSTTLELALEYYCIYGLARPLEHALSHTLQFRTFLLGVVLTDKAGILLM
jgi:hypothetical protein